MPKIKWLNSITSWWNRKSRARALKRITKLRRHLDPLGNISQFVYLDSIALRSLYVSRYGPEDARITITNSQTNDVGITSNASLSTGSSPRPVLTTNIGASLQSSSSQSIQIEHVASEQSLFRDFLVREEAAGKNSEIWDGALHVQNNSMESKILRRGDLIKVRIQLAADITYRLGSFSTAISHLAGEAPDLGIPGSETALQVGKLLQGLLINQVPIESELMDWGIDPATSKLVPKTQSSAALKLVALTQTDNYWIDVRRALFSKSQLIALVRISEDVPSTQWSPVKLFDAVKDIPGFNTLDTIVNDLKREMTSTPKVDKSHSDSLTKALVKYVEHFAPEKLWIHNQAGYIAKAHSNGKRDFLTTSRAFDAIEELIFNSGDDVFLIEEAAKIRSELFKTLEFSDTQPNEEGEKGAPPPEVQEQEEYFAVGEIVALYW